MKQTTLLLFSFTHSRSLNRWELLFLILTELWCHPHFLICQHDNWFSDKQYNAQWGSTLQCPLVSVLLPASGNELMWFCFDATSSHWHWVSMLIMSNLSVIYMFWTTRTEKGEHLQLMISCGKHPEPSWWFQSASGCRMTHFRISLRSLICCTIFGPVTFLQNTTFNVSSNVWQQGVVVSKENVRSIYDYSSCWVQCTAYETWNQI